jgi:hypothetical protein
MKRWIAHSSVLALAGALLLACTSTAAAQDAEEEEGGIRDNSFFVEEAYNQEPGVVQHIFNWVRQWDHDDGESRSFDFVFTEEIPIGSQAHQFSFAIPFASIYDAPVGGPILDEDGLGDIQLNYRYQLVGGGAEDLMAVSPRFSLILPSGNEDRDLGHGELGYQFNLPVSWEGPAYAYHFNAGMTILPRSGFTDFDGMPLERHDFVNYNLGFSTIRITNKKVQPLVELVALWEEDVDEFEVVDRSFELLLSPGVRWAPYTEDESQIVVGAAAPIGLSRDAPDIGVFFYLSVEHPLRIFGN